MKLFDMNKAPNPRRVRIYLAEKGIEVERVEIDITAGKNLTGEFLAINPRGTIPVLQLDDGTLIDESMGIIRYFEALYPEPSLLGRTPAEIGIIEAWNRRMEIEGMWNIALAFRHSNPAFRNRATQDARIETPQIPAMAERGLQLTRHWLADLEARLAVSPWVAGAAFTMADITAFVAIDFAKWAGVRPDHSHPMVQAFHARIRERPGSGA